VEAVTIGQPTGPLQVGGTVVVRAAVTSQPRGYLGEDGITWRSSNPAVASVSITAGDSAVLTLLAAGETVVTAQVAGAQNALTLQVAAAARPVTMILSAPSASFNATQGGGDPAEQTVGITVTGDASPSVGVVQYQGDGGDWLRAGLGARTGETTALTLRAVVGGLAAGTYNASVPITAGGDTRVLTVQLTLAPDPAAGPVEPNQAAERGITTLLAEYASAINAKNTGRVRDLFPSLPQDAIDDLLGLRNTDTYLLQLVPGSLRPGSQERTLEGDVMSSVLGEGNRGEAVRMVYTFGRGAQGWYVVALRAVR
jgi:hypothetical protein